MIHCAGRPSGSRNSADGFTIAPTGWRGPCVLPDVAPPADTDTTVSKTPTVIDRLNIIRHLSCLHCVRLAALAPVVNVALHSRHAVKVGFSI